MKLAVSFVTIKHISRQITRRSETIQRTFNADRQRKRALVGILNHEIHSFRKIFAVHGATFTIQDMPERRKNKICYILGQIDKLVGSRQKGQLEILEQLKKESNKLQSFVDDEKIKHAPNRLLAMHSQTVNTLSTILAKQHTYIHKFLKLLNKKGTAQDFFNAYESLYSIFRKEQDVLVINRAYNRTLLMEELKDLISDKKIVVQELRTMRWDIKSLHTKKFSAALSKRIDRQLRGLAQIYYRHLVAYYGLLGAASFERNFIKDYSILEKRFLDFTDEVYHWVESIRKVAEEKHVTDSVASIVKRNLVFLNGLKKALS